MKKQMKWTLTLTLDQTVLRMMRAFIIHRVKWVVLFPQNIDCKKAKKIINEEFVNNQQTFNWNIENEPLNEFITQFLTSMAFLLCFQMEKGIQPNSAVFSDELKHLIKFAEKVDGKWVYGFASHPRFAYWAYNILYRRRILDQGDFFLK